MHRFTDGFQFIIWIVIAVLFYTFSLAMTATSARDERRQQQITGEMRP